MARGRLNILQKVRENSGFGENTAGRFFNKDGFANVKKKGVNIFNRQSWYHTMLNLPARRFIIYLLCCYIAINFVFAIIYYLIGIEHLTGIDKSSPIKEFIRPLS